MPDPLWKAWFVGLVDGEGCFYAYRRVRGNGQTFEVGLKVSVVESMDFVNQIMNQIGCGATALCSNEKARQRGRMHNDYVRWRVRDRKSLTKIIIPLFDEFPLRTKKINDYFAWRKIIYLLEGRAHRILDQHETINLINTLKLLHDRRPNS